VIKPDIKFKTKGNQKFSELMKNPNNEQGIGSDNIETTFSNLHLSTTPFDEQPKKKPTPVIAETPFLDEFVAPDFSKPNDPWTGAKNIQAQPADPFAQFNGQSARENTFGKSAEGGRVLEKILSPNFLNLEAAMRDDMRTPFD
jgi:hypothetical protein